MTAQGFPGRREQPRRKETTAARPGVPPLPPRRDTACEPVGDHYIDIEFCPRARIFRGGQWRLDMRFGSAPILLAAGFAALFSIVAFAPEARAATPISACVDKTTGVARIRPARSGCARQLVPEAAPSGAPRH